MIIQNIHVHGKMCPHKFLNIIGDYDKEQFSQNQLWLLDVAYHEIISNKDKLEKMKSWYPDENLWHNLFDQIVYEYARFQQ